MYIRANRNYCSQWSYYKFKNFLLNYFQHCWLLFKKKRIVSHDFFPSFLFLHILWFIQFQTAIQILCHFDNPFYTEIESFSVRMYTLEWSVFVVPICPNCFQVFRQPRFSAHRVARKWWTVWFVCWIFFQYPYQNHSV